MLGLTRKGDYAIRAMVYLAQQPADSITLVNEISQQVEAPKHFLFKIFQELGKNGFVKSTRGSNGGYSLAKPSNEISLLDIIEAIEGPIIPNRCISSDFKCGLKPGCPVHPIWHKMEHAIKSILSEATLEALA
jgi:Rrf2 family transcriptional regulator, iron-sulfur cluster assembly transcription factor